MERMGFGLAVAPKFMDIIIKWVLRKFDKVDNYIDDVLSPKVPFCLQKWPLESAKFSLDDQAMCEDPEVEPTPSVRPSVWKAQARMSPGGDEMVVDLSLNESPT